MLVEFAVQGAAADAELLRGEGAVALAFGQSAADERQFGFAKIERQRAARGGVHRGAAHRGGQIAQGDFRSAGHDHAVFDGGAQLSHVARPVVADEGFQGVGGQLAQRFVVILGRFAQEVDGEQRDVPAAVAEGREVELDDVEAEEEVLAEIAFGDHLR